MGAVTDSGLLLPIFYFSFLFHLNPKEQYSGTSHNGHSEEWIVEPPIMDTQKSG